MFGSQLKDNPRVSYGDQKSKLGENAICFHSGLMLEVARTASKKIEEKVIGQTIQIKAG